MKRSERMSMVLLLLSQNPGKLFTLTHFSEQFGCAKSTMSEDISWMRMFLQEHELGHIETVTGAAGGVRYFPFKSTHDNLNYVKKIVNILQDRKRIVSGGFLYTYDVFSNPTYLQKLGEIIAQSYVNKEPDVVVTVENKGVPIGLMTAQALGKPLIIVRKESRPTEGSAVMINYIASSSRKIRTMSLPRKAIKPGQKALIVDDFAKNGGTARAICEMMNEFSTQVVGISTLIAAEATQKKREADIQPLMVLKKIEGETEQFDLRPADWLYDMEFSG